MKTQPAARRVVRLADLSPAQRAIVISLIEAKRAAEAAQASGSK